MQEIISGKCCEIIEFGNGGPVFLYGYSKELERNPETIPRLVRQNLPEQSLTFITYQVDKWMDDFSPWPANGETDMEKFGGRGEETLQWMENSLVPFIKEKYPQNVGIFPVGYSLCGLFSLWTVYMSEEFSGAASCSGSLWFQGWDEFARETKVKKNSIIYLSLGGKEEKTRNPVVATVGDRTRLQLELLKKDSHVKDVKLEMNPGGHFTNPDERVAKGVMYLCRHCS